MSGLSFAGVVVASAFLAAVTSAPPAPQADLFLKPAAPPNLYGDTPNFAAPPAEASTEVVHAMRWGRRVYASSGPATDFRTPEGKINVRTAGSLSQGALALEALGDVPEQKRDAVRFRVNDVRLAGVSNLRKTDGRSRERKSPNICYAKYEPPHQAKYAPQPSYATSIFSGTRARSSS